MELDPSGLELSTCRPAAVEPLQLLTQRGPIPKWMKWFSVLQQQSFHPQHP